MILFAYNAILCVYHYTPRDWDERQIVVERMRKRGYTILEDDGLNTQFNRCGDNEQALDRPCSISFIRPIRQQIEDLLLQGILYEKKIGKIKLEPGNYEILESLEELRK